MASGFSGTSAGSGLTALRGDEVEPLVGEIVGLRTFRVDDCGLLLPLFSEACWYDGRNTAACTPPTGDTFRVPHVAPDPACECGFYAYGSVEAAQSNRGSRHVLAAVSCWGRVVAGTRGLRAEYARIDALWLAPSAPTWLCQRVAGRYPSVRIFRDRDAMLAAYPPSSLPCYRATTQPTWQRHLRTAGALAGGAALLAVGVLPGHLLHSSAAAWALWLTVTVCCGALTAWNLLASRAMGHLSAAAITAAVLAWLLAPLFGWPGWLLRLPVLRAVAVTVGARLLALRPHHFPVVAGRPRERGLRALRS